MTPITLEPPRYGMTGPECGITSTMRPGTDWDAVQPLDAPEYIARGSVRSGHQTINGSINGSIYVSTTDAMYDRMFGSKQ